MRRTLYRFEQERHYALTEVEEAMTRVENCRQIRTNTVRLA